MRQLYLWLSRQEGAWYGTALFMILIATEGFFILPVSALLVFFCLENRSKSFTYAGLATSLTGLGTLLGYSIGYLLHQWDSHLFLGDLVAQATFHLAAERFEEYQGLTSFAVALSPLPYRTLSIAGGFLGVPLVPFIALSITARGIRFFAIASAVHFWGEHLKQKIDTHFYWIFTAGTLSWLLLCFVLT